MSNRSKVIQWSVAFLMVAAPLLAHSGHGTTPADHPAHYMIEPWHAAQWLSGLLVAGLLFVIGRRRSHRRG